MPNAEVTYDMTVGDMYMPILAIGVAIWQMTFAIGETLTI